MANRDQIKYCINCKNKRVEYERGIVCDLTGFPPDFDGICPSYDPVREDDRITNSNAGSIKAISYRPNSERATTAKVSLFATIVLNVLHGFALNNSIKGLHKFQAGGISSESAYSEIMLFQGATAVLLTLMIVVNAITFINWFRRGYFNLNSQNAGMEYSNDEQAVWAWLIPIVSWYRPYTMMVQMWEKSKAMLNDYFSNKYKDYEVHMISVWWFFWVASNIAGTISYWAYKNDETIPGLISSFKLDIYIIPIEIIAAIGAIVIITKYNNLEEAIAYQLRNNDMPELG